MEKNTRRATRLQKDETTQDTTRFFGRSILLVDFRPYLSCPLFRLVFLAPPELIATAMVSIVVLGVSLGAWAACKADVVVVVLIWCLMSWSQIDFLFSGFCGTPPYCEAKAPYSQKANTTRIQAEPQKKHGFGLKGKRRRSEGGGVKTSDISREGSTSLCCPPHRCGGISLE